MGDLKSELEAIFRQPPACPKNKKYDSIAQLYDEYREHLEDTCVQDPCGEKNFFRPENFAHLVKLEFFNQKIKAWVDANSAIAINQLRTKTLDETRYRIGDESRPRTLFWTSDIIVDPDSIHENRRNNATEVYAKRFARANGNISLKLVVIEKRFDLQLVVKTSFWSDEDYHKECVKYPPKYQRRK
ncbi:MAG TPA: hypothetical protein VMF56_11210 [Acidobacteriaceae bacterium]|nr:hypothetical protein [Acidobacteriaceae bacterium]